MSTPLSIKSTVLTYKIQRSVLHFGKECRYSDKVHRKTKGIAVPETNKTTYHHGNLEQAIVAYAFETIRAQGVQGFSLRKAARELGVDPAATYRHFANKKAVLARVASQAFALLAQHMETSMAQAHDAESRFRASGEAYLQFAIENPELLRIAFGPLGSGSHTFEVRGLGSRGLDPYQLLLGALEDLYLAGNIRVPAQAAALPAWCSIHGLAYLVVDGNLTQATAATAAKRVMDNVLHGLRSPGI